MRKMNETIAVLHRNQSRDDPRTGTWKNTRKNTRNSTAKNTWNMRKHAQAGAWERAREHETLSAPEGAQEQRDSTKNTRKSMEQEKEHRKLRRKSLRCFLNIAVHLDIQLTKGKRCIQTNSLASCCINPMPSSKGLDRTIPSAQAAAARRSSDLQKEIS